MNGICRIDRRSAYSSQDSFNLSNLVYIYRRLFLDPSSHITFHNVQLDSFVIYRMINIFKLLKYMDGCIQLIDYDLAV
jgi:hypothetical protein